MTLNANSISKIEATKTAFEKAFKEKLVNDCFKTIVVNSIPLKEGEREKIDSPEFRDKFTNVLSTMSKDFVNQFDHVGQFDNGNLLTSMVNSVSDSVSLESNYRQQKLINDIRLGKVNQDVISINTACESAFADVKEFASKDVEKRFKQDLKYTLSIEDAKDVVERIKSDIKDAIEETEAKNDLVEGTTQEIIDYKNEIAPPDDQYQDPDNPDEDAAANDLMGTDDEDLISNPTDDGMSENGLDSEEEQIYESEDGLGTEPTSTGDDSEIPDDNLNTETPETDNLDTSTPDAGTEPSDNSGLDTGDDTADSALNGDNLGSDDASGITDDLGEPPADSNLDTPNADIGGTDGVVDQGDVGKPVENLGTDEDASSTPTVETEPAPAGQTAGVVININGANLAKENLNLFNARSLAEKEIPVHPKKFNGMVLPSIETLSAECVNAVGDVNKEFSNRLDYLKLTTKQAEISDESRAAINEKIDEYGKIIGESISNANTYNKCLSTLGLTSQGLIRSNENTLIIARNIINRFLLNKQLVSPTTRPYTSKENVFANAFDIVQLRQYLNKQKNPKTEMIDDLESRENVFYHNLVNYDDESVKKEASTIVDLSKLNFRKAMSPNFITDYRIKVWEENVGDKSNFEINEEVVKRVKEKFEKLWCRPLNDAEMEIIKATTNQDDVTEIIPTPYEKFLISMSKEAVLARGSEDKELGAKPLTSEEKKNIEWKARLMTTVYKTAEAFGILSQDDKTNFEKFTSMVIA